MSLRALAWSMVLPLLACGPGPDGLKAFPGRHQQAILSGAVDSADLAVFNLVILDARNDEFTCSATLIGKRTLLTAAHCVDPAEYGGRVTLYAHNQTTRAGVTNGQLLGITASRVHPQYDPVNIGHDLGLALLAVAPGVPAVKFNKDVVARGLALRAVGYGVSAFDGAGYGYGDGTRRSASMAVGDVTTYEYEHVKPQGRGICDGDSGGPSLATFADGERVVGVHSYTEGDRCEQGFDQRVDAHAAFIEQWLREKEPPACVADALCEAGCSSDPDCATPPVTPPLTDPVVLPLAHTEGQAAAGCAVAPGALALLWPLALLLRRRARLL